MDQETKEYIVAEQKGIFNSDIEDFYVDNINEYLKMSDQDLKLLSKEDCDVINYNITKHKLFIQSKVNRNRTYCNKAKLRLKRLVARDISQYKGMSWDYAEQNAINNNDVAENLQKEISKIEDYLTLAYNLIPILDDYSKRIESIKFWRRENE